MKKLILLIGTLFLLISCSNTIPSEDIEIPTYEENPIICMTLSNNKTITCELYPEIAPISVTNFLNLIDSGFYNDTIFHRVIRDFVIQGGGFYIKDNTVYHKEAQTIKGEFAANGVENNLSHTAGVLSMARANDNNSASSQFFICVADCTELDGKYAAFGKTVDEESLNNAIEMSLALTSRYPMADFPIEPISIIKIERIIKNNEGLVES